MCKRIQEVIQIRELIMNDDAKEMAFGSLVFLILVGFMFGCCSTNKDICYTPEYQKTITLVEYPDHSKCFEIKLSMWKFINTKYEKLHDHRDNLAKRAKIEAQLRREVREEGLYINKLEYIEDKHNDTYLICEASQKPTFREDWEEHRKHRELHDYMLLQKRYGTNTNVKCECRYCTTGLHHKYWYP